MRKEEYIQEVISKIENKKARREVEKELSDHIDDRISYYTDAGWDEETANIKAMEHMGEPKKVSEEMGKLHNKRLKTFLKILLSLFLIISILFLAQKIYFYLQPVDSFIKDGTKVYTPSGIPLKHHIDFMSIDIYEYWVYKLNDNQSEAINADLKELNWEKMTSNHFERFPFDYKEVFMKRTEVSNDCYVVIYDAHNKQLITNNPENIIETTTHWVIIVYDKANNYYYCIHESI